MIIKAQEKLKEFSFNGAESWVEEIIKALQFHANSLTSIQLNVKISASSLYSLAKCKNLKNLVLKNIKMPTLKN
ncbi:hypothetical protein C2G38_2236818 [Gigaspora rosea]|uniref:Uncharacterized protein n=1 Tax=Gigaspora rosea TaxID=44941 RepID=A0A397TNW8_9GLOM|nr:hypothetical protein C2G38_2236818 [Gigaspora rosea]